MATPPATTRRPRPTAALFFPVNPGAEEASWKRLFEEGLDRFFAGTFAGKYQEELLAEFDRYLPAEPPWKKMRDEKCLTNVTSV